jgi:hypothetical protein
VTGRSRADRLDDLPARPSPGHQQHARPAARSEHSQHGRQLAHAEATVEQDDAGLQRERRQHHPQGRVGLAHHGHPRLAGERLLTGGAAGAVTGGDEDGDGIHRGSEQYSAGGRAP